MALPVDARRALHDAFGEPEAPAPRPKPPGQLLREAERAARQLRRERRVAVSPPEAPPNGVKMLEWVRTGLELGLIPEAALRDKLRELFSAVAAPPAAPPTRA